MQRKDWKLKVELTLRNDKLVSTLNNLKQTGPHPKPKVLLAEFEACGALCVTTATTNPKPCPSSYCIDSNIYTKAEEKERYTQVIVSSKNVFQKIKGQIKIFFR